MERALCAPRTPFGVHSPRLWGSASHRSSARSGRRSRRPAAETDVEFLSPEGHRLVGTLRRPEQSGAGHPAPCILLCHGYMSSRNSELLVRLAGALARTAGLATFRFDHSGNGDSEGRFRYGHYRSEAEEVRAAKQHLEAAEGLSVAGLVGHSKGGTTAVVYAGKYDDIPRLVNIAGRFDVCEGVEARLRPEVLEQLRREGQVEMAGRSRARGAFTWLLTREDLEDRLGTDVAAACAAIRHTRVLTLHGTADAAVPVSQAERFAAALAPRGLHTLALVPGADHAFSEGAAMYELAATALPFLAAAGAGEGAGAGAAAAREAG